MNPLLPLVLALSVLPPPGPADGDAERGYRLLLEKPYLEPDFDQQTFDELWRLWPEPLRAHAAAAGPEERRRLAYERYGLTPRPGDPAQRPLQYVVDERGDWTMNCFACHGGAVAGQVIPGRPNSDLALELLTEEVRATKRRLGKRLTRLELGLAVLPLGTTRGTTNAVMFGVALIHGRAPDLSPALRFFPPALRNHDMDAPPWWNYRRRQRLYVDGFAPKSHRALMQFVLIPENGPERFAAWEDDFRAIESYLESLTPPRFPWPVDGELAAVGGAVYEEACADCHGSRRGEGSYPNRVVRLDKVGTDPLRLEGLTRGARQRYRESWFAAGVRDEVVVDPVGYVAPLLDGIWASAPYLHNGSVPTLWHLLHPDERPERWRRTASGYDRERVGLAVEVPATIPAGPERREVHDASQRGKGAFGHRFPDALDAEEKRALLEYLKTL